MSEQSVGYLPNAEQGVFADRPELGQRPLTLSYHVGVMETQG